MQTSNNENIKLNTEAKAEKTAVALSVIVVIVLVLILAAVTTVFLLRNNSPKASTPKEAIDQYMTSIPIVTYDGQKMSLDCEPTTPEGKELFTLLKTVWRYEIVEEEQKGNNSQISVNFICPDLSVLPNVIRQKMKSEVETELQTSEKGDIYNSDDSYRSDVLDRIYKVALPQSCVEAPLITMNARITLTKYLFGWTIDNEATITDTIAQKAVDLKTNSVNGLEYVSKVYIIPENAKAGNIPNLNSFGETTDPNVISLLLESKYAKNLINNQELVWNPQIAFLEGSTIAYYLDESILMIQWQQNEAGMVGTFAEVFISDSSQLRRKIAGDAFGDMNFKTCSDFSKDVNAVLAVGGDFYNHGRNCGIVVYDRNIYRLDYSTCDVCYFTSSGDMLFSYRNQFSNQEQVKKFVEENEILWSLSFGPVLIDNGVDVTPNSYMWGEINDTYARSALGLMGKNHYLTMNLNCGNTSETRGYATLRQAADAMASRGCIKAYTLDGGQTATTAIYGVLRNPVQFGWEKQISDIVYFATSVPNG